MPDRRETNAPMIRNSTTALCAAGLGVMTLAGCSAGSSPGSLEQIDMRPACGGFDEVCLQRGLDAPIAVGSSLTLGLDFNLGGSTPPQVSLESQDIDVLDAEALTVTAEGEGMAALYVVAEDDRVMDFVHLWTLEPDALEIRDYEHDPVAGGRIDDEATLFVGELLRLDVVPMGAEQQLTGEFTVEWSSSSDAVEVHDDPVEGLTRLRAANPGLAIVTVSALGLSREVRLEVVL